MTNAPAYDLFNPVPEMATASPINKRKLGGTNMKVYNYMIEHGSIDMVRAYKIGIINLFARCFDLKTVHGIKIYSRFIMVGDTKCKQYSLNEFQDEQV